MKILRQVRNDKQGEGGNSGEPTELRVQGKWTRGTGLDTEEKASFEALVGKVFSITYAPVRNWSSSLYIKVIS